MKSKYRLGIDAGGTFTDFVLAERPDKIHLFKSTSTPQDGTIAIMDGLNQMSAKLGESVKDIISQTDLCINGTTVCLNALIEKKGAKVGLICTAGHEDSIEIRLGHKEEGYRYDSSYPPAHMLAPRYLRMPINERIIIDGSVHKALDEDEVREAVSYLKKQGVNAVAISYLWSVVNPKHEQRTKEIVQEMMPGIYVCTGSEVYPQIREYTRTSTTIVNAYLSPIMSKYVSKIDDLFRDLGAKHPVRFYQSNGGLAIGSAMSERAVNAINSGPASAPQAALQVAEPFGINNVITVDMGGTSFDITLTKDGVTNLNKNIDFLRYRIGVPMIQVETLGAGGGSIAHLNALGMLEVGPQSAGSEPGPVCYGKGGTKPTVTDANIVMGYLNPNAVLGGTITLDRDIACAAIKKHIADPLGISVERAAFGISTIVNINMVNGIRRVSIERGYDPRDFALVCAGGASGMHIMALADEMGITQILVPKIASGLCAFGQIISDVRYNYLTTMPTRLDDDVDFTAVNEAFNDLETRGTKHLISDGFAKKDINIARSVEMRYVGQIHECTVDIDNQEINANTIENILNAFHTRHKSLYSYSEPDSEVELVNMESLLTASVSKPSLPTVTQGDGNPLRAKMETRDMVLDDSCVWTQVTVYEGGKLLAGDVIKGPALIEEPTTTIVILKNWICILHKSGCYNIRKDMAS